jgi:hypothetical protein
MPMEFGGDLNLAFGNQNKPLEDLNLNHSSFTVPTPYTFIFCLRTLSPFSQSSSQFEQLVPRIYSPNGVETRRRSAYINVK